MALPFTKALDCFISQCAEVTAVHDLITKWRLDLLHGYVMDCYFNQSLGKYSYTLIKDNKRIMGWDNAPHHPGLPNFPHHFHTLNRQILPSPLVGNPENDLELFRLAVESFLRERGEQSMDIEETAE